jgi:uncharacterized membrane protein
MIVFGVIRARPRLFLSAALALVVSLALPSSLTVPTRGIIGWDVGVAAFLVSVAVMMARADIAHVRRRAAREDEGRLTILTLTVAAACFSLFAIGAELHAAKGLPPVSADWRIGLAAGTVVLSWSFTHVIFALHYAHTYYRGRKAGEGLAFPGDQPADYLDFLYFAFVVGMTCQVSDVQVTGRTLRRLTLSHGVVSFFFNTGILALAINLAAGLF